MLILVLLRTEHTNIHVCLSVHTCVTQHTHMYRVQENNSSDQKTINSAVELSVPGKWSLLTITNKEKIFNFKKQDKCSSLAINSVHLAADNDKLALEYVMLKAR